MRRPRPLVAALVGVAIAAALEWWRPGEWQRGSTPRLVLTALVAAVTVVALAWSTRRRPPSA